MAPLFLTKRGGHCMPHGACTFLRGLTHCPQRLLLVAYVTTAAAPTPCRATTIWIGLQATQQAPTIEKTAGGTSLHDRACLPQHPTAWAANSPVTTVLVCSQRTRMMMHTLRSVHPLLGTFKRPPELVCMTEPACHSIQLHGQPTALSQLFSFTGSE